MPENEFDIHCDLIERELRGALKDIAYIRANKPEAKRRCKLVSAALKSARHYLREFENSL